MRHAESRANVEKWFSGHADVELTARGRQQARELGRRLASERVQTVLSSDLQRAADTARIAFAGRPFAMRLRPALRERDIGAWTGVPLQDVPHDALWAVLDGWVERPPAGESAADVAARVVPALASERMCGPTAVFAHGGVLRVVLGLADGWPIERIPKRPVANTSVHVRELPDDFWQDVAQRLG